MWGSLRVTAAPQGVGSALGSGALTAWLSLDGFEEGPRTHSPHFHSPLPSAGNNRLFLLLPVLTNSEGQVICTKRQVIYTRGPEREGTSWDGAPGPRGSGYREIFWVRVRAQEVAGGQG